MVSLRLDCRRRIVMLRGRMSRDERDESIAWRYLVAEWVVKQEKQNGDFIPNAT